MSYIHVYKLYNSVELNRNAWKGETVEVHHLISLSSLHWDIKLHKRVKIPI